MHASKRWLSAKQFVYVQRRCFSVKSLQNGFVMAHSNNVIPWIGVGTWGSDYFNSQQIADSVKIAIQQCNYKHIDCASVYNNQHEIGQVLQDCFEGNYIDRRSLHITSKIWNNEHENVCASVERTLKDLNTHYLDLCLIHWPFCNDHKEGAQPGDRDTNAKPFDINEYMDTWTQMNDALNQGLVKNIGVSNMTVTKLKQMFDGIQSRKTQHGLALKYPVVNQVELHPYFQQPNLLQFCHWNDIILTAAMPVGSPQRPDRDRSADDPVVTEDAVLRQISEELNISVVQVVIAWHINRGTVCVPKATEKWMLQENMKASTIRLSQEHMDRIAAIDRNHRLTKGQVFCWYDNQPWQELWDNE